MSLLTTVAEDAYPTQIIDVKRRSYWVKQHIDEYGGDPDFIVVTGVRRVGTSLLAGLTPGHSDWQEGLKSIRQCKVSWHVRLLT